MDKQNRMWELLAKKSAGEADENELKELDEWLGKGGEDVQYMMGALDHYWASVQGAAENEKMQNACRGRGEKAMGKLITGGREAVPMKRRKKYLLWAAAAVACLVGGWLMWQATGVSSPEMNVVATKNGSRTKITLPDGTRVWLNADSRLTYPNDFQHVARREVALSGEAYFEVKHDASHPFIIHTKYLDIKDIGTAFNVRSYPGDAEAEATLVSGSIEVSLRNDPGKSLVLKPKEKVMYYSRREALTLQKDQPAERNTGQQGLPPASRLEVTRVTPVISPSGDSIVTETAWMHDQLIFSGEKFEALAKRLDRWYNVRIEIGDEAIKNYTFSGIFQGETLEQALKELQMIRPFHFVINKDQVTISQ